MCAKALIKPASRGILVVISVDLTAKSEFAGGYSVNNRAGTLLDEEKNAKHFLRVTVVTVTLFPRREYPLDILATDRRSVNPVPQKPFIAFSPFGDTSPNNEKVVRVYKRVRRKFFSEELTQLYTEYSSTNSDLPQYAYRVAVGILLGVFSLKLFFSELSNTFQ